MSMSNFRANVLEAVQMETWRRLVSHFLSLLQADYHLSHLHGFSMLVS